MSEPPEPLAEPLAEPPPRESARLAVDLGSIERDLAAVEMALSRLDDGTYFTDELTGEPIPDDLLAASPLVRRVG